jgi:hypothetical protein
LRYRGSYKLWPVQADAERRCRVRPAASRAERRLHRLADARTRMGKNTGPQTGGCIIKARKHSPSLILTCITVSITRSGGLAVKRITSNDEIPGSSPGRSLVDNCFFFALDPPALLSVGRGGRSGVRRLKRSGVLNHRLRDQALSFRPTPPSHSQSPFHPINLSSGSHFLLASKNLCIANSVITYQLSIQRLSPKCVAHTLALRNPGS